MKILPGIIAAALLASAVLPAAAQAQQVLQDTVLIEKAQVVDAGDSQAAPIAGTNTTSQEQKLTAEVLEGSDKGRTVTFENDYTQLKTGDLFYIRHEISASGGPEYWSVSDPYRLNLLIGLAAVFVALLLLFGGIQGIRGLASFCGSLVLIFFLLLPGILNGLSPVLVGLGVASLIIILGSYITHGFNRTTSAAVLGMIGTVVITGLGAYYVVHTGHFSGFTTEENVYLNFNTNGNINMVGLLFAGIMIGLLGVLYDIAIGQAIAVEELYRAATHYARKEIYRRAIRIGREHIGALVNTLAIAYVGASLPLLLLIQQTSTTGLGPVLNSELIATEIVRILIGSIGLVLGVPITTLIATYMLWGKIEKTPHREGEEVVHVHRH